MLFAAKPINSKMKNKRTIKQALCPFVCLLGFICQILDEKDERDKEERERLVD